MKDEILDKNKKRIIGDKPNTYIFSKHLAEELLRTEASDLPTCIVRPSLVTAAWKDPIPVSAHIYTKSYFTIFLNCIIRRLKPK